MREGQRSEISIKIIPPPGIILVQTTCLDPRDNGVRANKLFIFTKYTHMYCTWKTFDKNIFVDNVINNSHFRQNVSSSRTLVAPLLIACKLKEEDSHR